MKLFMLIVTFLAFNKKHNYCLADQDYIVNNDEIVPMKGEGETLVEFKNLKTVGRQHFVNGSIVFLEDMDDDHFKFSVEILSSPNGDGIYKRTQLNVAPVAICEGFKKFYKEFVQPSFTHGENTNIPFIGDDGLCPIPAGEYYFMDILFNTEAWPNKMPRGGLQVIVKFYKDDVIVGGMTASMNIEDDTR